MVDGVADAARIGNQEQEMPLTFWVLQNSGSDITTIGCLHNQSWPPEFEVWDASILVERVAYSRQ
jgi:hypothetical protein